jgi:hypothetical protein
VIIWDAAHHTEHFIRRAAFRSTARSFGFLVPTPTAPELGEVDDSVFWSLADAIRPEVRYETTGWSVSPESWCLGSFLARKGGARDDAMAPAVRVIASAHVAGFDATTLEADDATALASWLGAHGFEATPALTVWLERYVATHWKMTAFVVATDERGGSSYELATRAVRMSFHADQPFYPYREPAAPATSSTADPNRLLRVFFLATERYAATLEGQPWSARVLHAAPLQVPTPLVKLAEASAVATVFQDASALRRGVDEIYFAVSADQAPVRQPPIIVTSPHRVPVPIEFLLVLGIGVAWGVRWRRRTRRGIHRSG